MKYLNQETKRLLKIKRIEVHKRDDLRRKREAEYKDQLPRRVSFELHGGEHSYHNAFHSSYADHQVINVIKYEQALPVSLLSDTTDHQIVGSSSRRRKYAMSLSKDE